jgi:hypothetical protein
MTTQISPETLAALRQMTASASKNDPAMNEGLAELQAAQVAQTVYWNALRALERVTGVDLDDVGDLAGLTVQDVIESFGPNGFGGADDADEDGIELLICDECGSVSPTGPCRQCGEPLA